MLQELINLTACETIQALDRQLFQIFAKQFGADSFLLYKNVRAGSSLYERIENPPQSDSAQPLSMDELSSLVSAYERPEARARWFQCHNQNSLNALVVVFDGLEHELELWLERVMEVYGNLQSLLNRAQLDGLTYLNNRRMFDVVMPRMLEDIYHQNERRQQYMAAIC